MAQTSHAPIPWRWYLVALAAVALSGVVALGYYDRIPDPMPVHFNAAGEADGFREKTLLSYLAFVLFTPLFLIATGIGSAALISAQANGVATDSMPKRSDEEKRKAIAGLRKMQKPLAGFLIALGAVISVAMYASLGVWGSFQLNIWWILGGIAVVTAVFVVIVSRIQRDTQKDESMRWGIIYYDKEDPRVFVDQYGGMNTTLNFARPAAWAVLAAILLPLAAVLIAAFLGG